MMPISTGSPTPAAHGNRVGAPLSTTGSGTTGFSALLGAAVDAVASPGTAPDAGMEHVSTSVSPAHTLLHAPAHADAKSPARSAATADSGDDPRNDDTSETLSAPAGSVATAATGSLDDTDVARRDDTADLPAGEDADASIDTAQAQQAVDAMLSWLQAAAAASAATPAHDDSRDAVATRNDAADGQATVDASASLSAPSAPPEPDPLMQDRPTDTNSTAGTIDMRQRALAHQAAQASAVADQPPRHTSVVAAEHTLAETQHGGNATALNSAGAEILPVPLLQASAGAATTAASVTPSAAAPVQPPLHMPALFGSDGWSQAFGQQVLWSARQQLQSASLTLNPPQLGPVRIALQLTDKRASAQFSSHQAEVRQAIEQALPQLKELFASAGLELQQASVDSGQSRQQDRPGGSFGAAGSSGPAGWSAPSSGEEEARIDSVRARPAIVQRLLDTYA